MPVKVQIRIDTTKFEAKLGPEGRRRIIAALRPAMMEAMYELRDHVRASKLSGQALGIRTGNLHRSITPNTIATEKGVIGTVWTDVQSPAGFPYGWYWEKDGTAHGGPRPFLMPSLLESQDAIKDKLVDALAEVLRG